MPPLTCDLPSKHLLEALNHHSCRMVRYSHHRNVNHYQAFVTGCLLLWTGYYPSLASYQSLIRCSTITNHHWLALGKPCKNHGTSAIKPCKNQGETMGKTMEHPQKPAMDAFPEQDDFSRHAPPRTDGRRLSSAVGVGPSLQRISSKHLGELQWSNRCSRAAKAMVGISLVVNRIMVYQVYLPS